MDASTGSVQGLEGVDEQLVRQLAERARAEGLKLTGKGRLLGIDDLVISLSAKELTHGEISAHLAEIYGAQVSKQTISTITDRVMDGMAAWQSRPLDAVYPVIFIDCVNVKIRDGNVANRP